MKTRSVLVSFPGYRFRIETLLPNHRLASLAASLRETGHRTVVCDCGTASMLDRFFPKKTHATAKEIADRILSEPSGGTLSTLSTLWQMRGMDRVLRTQQEAVAAEVAAEILTDGKLDFVVLDINEQEDLRGSLALATQLRGLAPDLRLVAVGAFAEQYAETLLRVTGLFDCVSVQDADWSLARWAERLNRPDTWRLIPNLVYAQHGYVRPTEEHTGLELESLPMPAYDEETYPALSSNEKLLLPGVEVSRAGASEPVSRTRSARAICDEAGHWMRTFGVKAFRFLGPEAPCSHADALAYEILSRGQTMWYSRQGAIRETRLQSFAALKSSGCQSVSFDIGSGSQMLLDDFYHRDIGVTETENVLRACKKAGIFTVAGFTYPCAADDYHSRAETLRLVERTRPDSALVGMPSFSLAMKRGSSAHMFDVTPDEYMRYVLSGRDRFSIPVLKSRNGGYFRNVRSLADVLRENDVLTREFAGIGIGATLTADAALVARVCGYEGQEEDFDAIFRQRLFSGDAAGVTSAVERFNQRATALSNVLAFKPLAPVLAAVGN